eukprot:4208255-Pyramimonas_sp.AAC.1
MFAKGGPPYPLLARKTWQARHAPNTTGGAFWVVPHIRCGLARRGIHGTPVCPPAARPPVAPSA